MYEIPGQSGRAHGQTEPLYGAAAGRGGQVIELGKMETDSPLGIEAERNY